MIDKVRRSLRERGARGTLSRLVGSLREGYAEEELIVLFKELDDVVEPQSLGRLTIEEINAGHLQGLYALNRKRGEPGADRYFERSLQYGYHGFAACVEDELVGYYWWVDRDSPVSHPDLWRLGRGFELGKRDLYGSGLFLLEEYRGDGRADEFLFRVESALRARGYDRLWGYVEKGNRAARWLYATRGYEPAWKVRTRRLGFFRWRKSSPVSDGA
jgi:GNAT superfamily N-acetyltransferase